MSVTWSMPFTLAPVAASGEPSVFHARVAAVPGEGFVVVADQDAPRIGNVDPIRIVAGRFDADGLARGESFALTDGEPAARYLFDAAVSLSGAIAAMFGGPSGLNARIVDSTGQPIGGEIALASRASPVDIIAGRSVVPFPDGSFAVVWNQGNYREAQFSEAFFRFIAPSGDAAGEAHPFERGSGYAGGTLFGGVAADGGLAVAGETDAGTALWRFSQAGETIAGPVLLRSQDGAAMRDLDRLADGDLAVTWQDGDGTLVQRFTAEGTPVDATVRAGLPDGSATDVRLAALQDGGFVAAWLRYTGAGYEAVFRIFDRGGTAVTDAIVYRAGSLLNVDVAVLDDGRFAIVTVGIVDGRAVVSGHILDYAASHTPAAGGTGAAVAHWWEQEAIARSDGVDMLAAGDSLALKPFIANVTLTGEDDLAAAGNSMANRMIGNAGANILVGYEANDSLVGEAGDDFLAAGRGDDTALGGSGDDIVWGGQGRDLLLGGDGADTLNGDRHDDVVDGEGGNDVVNGGSGADRLAGGDGDDIVGGGQGDDSLRGDGGADTLAGDQGDDRLEGGDGGDRFVFADRSGRDTIADFDYEAGDRIAIRLDAGGAMNGIPIGSIDDLWARSADALHGFTVDVGDGNTVTLWGQIRYGLTAEIFEIVT